MGMMTRLRALENKAGSTVPKTVAATGSIQTDAASVSAGLTVVTGADGTKGVSLPLAVPNMSRTIKNNANAILKVWPALGDGINAIAVNSPMSIAAFTIATFHAYDATTWYSSPLLPS